jgi:hypothetical protein
MRKQLHGLRHGMSFEWNYLEVVVDTKSDPEWVMLVVESEPFARQCKLSCGRKFRQGTNPDYEGYDAYQLEYYHNGKWHVYDSAAHRGDIRGQLGRLVESAFST